MTKTYEIFPPGMHGKPAGDVDLKHGSGRALKPDEMLSHAHATRAGVVARCCGYQKNLSMVGMSDLPKQQGGKIAGMDWRSQRHDIRYMPMPEDPYWHNIASQSRQSR